VTWEEVATREFESWVGDHIRIDTAGQKIEQSLASLAPDAPSANCAVDGSVGSRGKGCLRDDVGITIGVPG
jgi:hypothetical protein